MTTESNVQTLHLGKNEPINIVTPLGVVRLERDEKDSRRIRFTFPPVEGFKAFKGNKPEVESMPLVQNEDGHLVAQFDMLVPIRNSDGNTVAFGIPQMFRLVEEEKKTLHGGDCQPSPEMSGMQEESLRESPNVLRPVSDVRENDGSDCLGQPMEAAC